MRPALARLLLLGGLGLAIECLPAMAAGSTDPGKKPPPPPSPPLVVSPAGIFRRLLAMTTAEREEFLATKTAEQRQVIEFKLREYLALSPEAREARLQSLQTRVLVRQLIRLPASQRTERLSALAPDERRLVEARLAQWDQLAPDLQREVLQYEPFIRAVARSETAGPGQPTPTGRPSPVERDLARWRALPEERQRELVDQFQRFFDELSERDKTKVLNALSHAERQQMEKTLQDFARLPKPLRDRCIAGFQQFAELSPTERQQFLLNAQHWHNMSPRERETWRALVDKLKPPRPPLPPGAEAGLVPALPARTPPLVTNR